MKYIHLIICFYFIILMSCNKGIHPTTAQDTLSGTWKLVQHTDILTGKTIIEPDSIERSIVLIFNDDKDEGVFTGHTVANTVSGKYKILPDNKLIITEFQGTQMLEPFWGDLFWGTL